MVQTNGMTLAKQQMLFDAFSAELADLRVIAADEGQDQDVREMAQEGIAFVGEWLASMQVRRPIVEGAVEL